MLRICRKCKEEKNVDEFNKYINRHWCKKCKNKIDLIYYYKNKDKMLERQREYNYTEKGKEVTTRNTKNMYMKYPEKWKARVQLRYAVKTGRVHKLHCKVCKDSKTEAHHPDYSKPLEVQWLCRTHHSELHVSLRGLLSKLKLKSTLP